MAFLLSIFPSYVYYSQYIPPIFGTSAELLFPRLLVSEKEPSRVPENADTGNQTGGEQSGTVETDK